MARRELGSRLANDVSMGSREIGQHAEHLANDLSQTDERVEARLHQQFDHSLGRLEHKETLQLEASVELVDEISQMLAKPEGIRQMILANEILRRPDFR